MFFYVLVAFIARIAVATDLPNGAFQDLDLFAQYTAAAYFTNNFPEDSKMVCTAGNGLTLPEERVYVEGVYRDATLPGFLIVDVRNRLTILSFPGNHDLISTLTEEDVSMKPINDVCDDCRIGTRFWNLWMEIEASLTDDIRRAVSAYPQNRFAVTGHNFGGAVATLAAAIVSKHLVDGQKADLFTYGSLRAGDDVFAAHVTSNVNVYRATHKADVFPLLPGKSLGFSHPGPEYWISSDNEKLVTASNVHFLDERESAYGNSRFGVLEGSVADNHWYFGNIDAGR